jgi:hypothetical protein
LRAAGPNRLEDRGASMDQIGSMSFLVRFSLGRVFLHLLAMAGDGAVRFHAAGIRREFELTL